MLQRSARRGSERLHGNDVALRPAPAGAARHILERRPTMYPIRRDAGAGLPRAYVSLSR